MNDLQRLFYDAGALDNDDDGMLSAPSTRVPQYNQQRPPNTATTSLPMVSNNHFNRHPNNEMTTSSSALLSHVRVSSTNHQHLSETNTTRLEGKKDVQSSKNNNNRHPVDGDLAIVQGGNKSSPLKNNNSNVALERKIEMLQNDLDRISSSHENHQRLNATTELDTAHRTLQTQSNTIRQLEGELREERNRCQKLQEEKAFFAAKSELMQVRIDEVVAENKSLLDAQKTMWVNTTQQQIIDNGSDNIGRKSNNRVPPNVSSSSPQRAPQQDPKVFVSLQDLTSLSTFLRGELRQEKSTDDSSLLQKHTTASAATISRMAGGMLVVAGDDVAHEVRPTSSSQLVPVVTSYSSHCATLLDDIQQPLSRNQTITTSVNHLPTMSQPSSTDSVMIPQRQDKNAVRHADTDYQHVQELEAELYATCKRRDAAESSVRKFENIKLRTVADIAKRDAMGRLLQELGGNVNRIRKELRKHNALER